MREQYDEEKLKSIILGVSGAPDFGVQYDELLNRPYVRGSEVVNELGVMETLVRAQERVRELSHQDGIEGVQLSPDYNGGITITYRRVVSRDEYIDTAMRAWRQSSPTNNYKGYLFRALGLRNQSSIRNIYVKLLLEHKITLEDFRDLVDSKDAEINLIALLNGAQEENQNYFI